MADVFNQIKQDVNTLLYDETNPFGKGFAKIEEVTKRKREECFAAVSALVALYLIVGYSAELLCNIIGFVYPAYMTIRAIEGGDKKENTQWLSYWTIFGLYTLFDFFGEAVRHYYPFYWLSKCIFLMWLYLPIYRGAEKLYESHLHPFAVSHIVPSGGEAQ
ncbi:TB2 DP1 HVA22 domain containing protein [Trichuris trichiura]|uniref:Receptor expression-enhancing protein n=1 Tax=Trichuris trichiura TaxID=36087 RepID=A0A077Z831_TRITR|nr:TB2 DP1 HVA22 domain containing protein [Trichuris trichiura]